MPGCSAKARNKRLSDDGATNATTDTARRMVGGRCSALFHVDRIRAWPSATRLRPHVPWTSLLTGTGIDPLRDVERAYVTANTYDGGDCALVLDLAFDDIDRVCAALTALSKRAQPSDTELELPAVRTKFEGAKYAVTPVGGRTLIAVPEADADGLAAFAGLAGLPLPTRDEAVLLHSVEPCVTLEGTIPWPKTIARATSMVGLHADGSVTIDFVAVSRSAEQARLDAAALETMVNQRLSVDLYLLKVPVIAPIRFVARGAEIDMTAQFSQTELEVLLSLAEI